MFARALAGADGPTTYRSPDGRFARLERNPSPDVLLRVRIDGETGAGAFPLTAFAPAPERPASYPADLPFLHDRPVMLAVGGGQRILAWLNVLEPEAMREEVARQSVRDGWQSGPVERELLGARTVLRKGGLERALFFLWLPPMLKLVERMSDRNEYEPEPDQNAIT